MADKVYNIAREYDHPPYRRWAFSIRPDAVADEGYKIVDFDPRVADASFLAAFSDHMASDQVGQVPWEDEDAGNDLISTAHRFHPGQPEHFQIAIRSFRHGNLTAKSRGTR